MTGTANTKALTRRSLLRAALAGAGTATLAGCSSPVAAGLANAELDPGTVEYWNLFGGGDGVRMQQMQDGYRKANPATKLQAITLSWGNPYYNKLSLATLGDKPPNVAVSHLTRMKTLVRADLLQELHPEDLARHGMTPDMFNQRAWQAGLVNGKAYAIPIDTHPFVLFYNTKVCDQAGLLDADGRLKRIDGEAGFVDALDRVKQVTGQYGATHSINSDAATPWRLFQTMYSQLGGEILADNGTRIVLDDTKAKRVLAYLRTLTVEKKLMPSSIDYQGAIALFANGQAGFHLNGEWEISTFQTAKIAAALGDLVSDVDREALTDEFADYMAAVFRASVCTGIAGWRDDDLAFIGDWGFDLGAIKIPVSVWQGAEDRMVPYAHGRWLASRLTGATVRLNPTEGHLSLMVNAFDDIVTELTTHLA